MRSEEFSLSAMPLIHNTLGIFRAFTFRTMKLHLTSTMAKTAELSNSELTELRNVTWQIDCPRMILRRKTATAPMLFYGPGFLSRSFEGLLRFKLYSSRKIPAEELHLNDSLEAGVRIPESVYYELAATDFLGRQWKSARLLPDFNVAAAGLPIAEGRLSEIVCEGKQPTTRKQKNCSLSIWIFDDLTIPTNAITISRKSTAHGQQKIRHTTRNAWRFRSCGIDFLLVKEGEDFLVVRAAAELEAFPKSFEDRVVESLQFVLGRPIPWVVMKTRVKNNVTLKLSSRQLGREDAEKSRFHPPLPPRPLLNPKTNRMTNKPHRKLFECYLKHTLSCERKRHPLWGHLNAVYKASTGSFIDAKAMTLAVAIESLLGSEYGNLGKPSKRDRKEIARFQTHLREWQGNGQVKARIEGAISQLLLPRALDKMRALAQRGIITEEQQRAWQKLRNLSTHSYQSTGLSSDKFLELIHQVEVLFYHLIFHSIGSQGPYIDFSLPGWPIKEYPHMLGQVAG